MSGWPEAALTIIINTFSILDILLILQTFFGIERCKRLWHYGVIAGVFIVLSVGMGIWLSDKEMLCFVVMCVYVAAVAAVLMKKRRWKPFLLFIPALLMYLQWDSVISLFDILFHLGKYEYTLAETSTYLYSLSSDILLFILLIVIMKKSDKTELFRLTKGETVLVSFFCIFCPVLRSVLQYLEEMFDNFMYSMAWVAFVLILNFAVFYGIFHRKKAKLYREISENYRQQFDEEYQYFKDYKKEQKDIAKFRHDWNNHLLMLTSMFEKGEFEKAKDYFAALSAENQSANRGILTGNEMVDIILSAKQEKLEQERIEVTCGSGLEQLQFIEPVDCCILFSNLIDNAIEANCKCDEGRYIRISVSRNAGMLMFVMENQMNGELKLDNEQLLSTKEDAELHGIGTRNAFEIIKKYHGEYRIMTEENAFTIQILFPLP